MCSTTRFVFKSPNTLLGLIPVGTNENTIPLRNVASVSSNVTFRAGRFILGLLLLIIGFSTLLGLGLLLVPLSILILLASFPTSLQVQNPAGGSTTIDVSPLEKEKLKIFVQELQNRVFADQSQVQHHEAQALRTQQLMMQQLSLQQQMSSQQQAAAFGMANMAQQQALHGQQVEAQIPPSEPNVAQLQQGASTPQSTQGPVASQQYVQAQPVQHPYAQPTTQTQQVPTQVSQQGYAQPAQPGQQVPNQPVNPAQTTGQPDAWLQGQPQAEAATPQASFATPEAPQNAQPQSQPGSTPEQPAPTQPMPPTGEVPPQA